jgi:hypothetical protein
LQIPFDVLRTYRRKLYSMVFQSWLVVPWRVLLGGIVSFVNLLSRSGGAWSSRYDGGGGGTSWFLQV